MSRVKISVIIPVYNGEEYLHECLTSVLKQSFKQLEIIVVNDSSTDNSQSIIDDFAQSDSRLISVILKKNKGVSTARNVGIGRAKGDYILFLDADDYWNHIEMVDELYTIAAANHTDMTTFGHCMVNETGKLFGHTANNLSPPTTHDLIKSSDWSLQYSACTLMVSRKLLNRHKIRFHPDLVMGEDALFCYTLYCYASTLTVIDKTYYCYRINEESANNTAWNSYKLSCTVLWFQAAIRAFNKSPAAARKPELLQALILERLRMLVVKLAPMAISTLNENELAKYIAIWAACFSHLDINYFNTRIFPNGWPKQVAHTLQCIMKKDVAGFRALYSKLNPSIQP